MLIEQRKYDGLRLSVKRGALCLESKTEAEGYELDEGEVNGTPYKKYIRKFSALTGRITKIAWYDRSGDFGTFRGLEITVKDAGEHYTLDLPYGKRQYDTFTKIAENIDYSKDVEIVAWPDKKDDRVTAFAIKQDGKFVQWRYVREEMGECPEATQNSLTKTWNFDAQREWLLERLLTVVAPACEAANAFDEVMPEYSGDDEERAAVQEEPTTVLGAVQKRAAEEKAKAVVAGADLTDLNNPLDSGSDATAAPPEDVSIPF